MKSHFLPLMILTTSLFAQGPAGARQVMMMQPKIDQAQSYLNLTDAQIQSLQQLRQSEKTALAPIMQQIAPLRQSLNTQLNSGSADAATVGKLMLSIQSLEQQMTTSRNSLRDQAQAVLTADQKTRLAALQSAADLMPAIHQAMALNLLSPPAGAEQAFGIATAGPDHLFIARPIGRPE
jgi:Spy/CpxP family protein refolding chaperone